MKTVKIISLILAAVSLLAAARVASAYTFVSGGGSACQPQTTDPISHVMQGASNPSTSTWSTFVCPLTLGTQTSNPRYLAAAVLRYIDNSSSDPFSCFVYQTFYGGSVHYSDPKYTCSTGGGCADETSSYTGDGYIQFNASELGSDLYNQFVDGNFGFFCTLPAKSSAESRVTSYYTWAY